MLVNIQACFGRAFEHGRNFILDILFPAECLSCEQEGEWICQSCLREIPYQLEERCPNCQKSSLFSKFCNSCKDKFVLDGILVAGEYNNILISSAIKSLKYKFVKNISKSLSEYLSVYLKKCN